MPSYAYRCVECMSQFTSFHGFNDRASCPCCNSSLCERIPSVGFSVSGKHDQRVEKVGDKVKDFIEESREELARQKEKLENKR